MITLPLAHMGHVLVDLPIFFGPVFVLYALDRAHGAARQAPSALARSLGQRDRLAERRLLGPLGGLLALALAAMTANTIQVRDPKPAELRAGEATVREP